MAENNVIELNRENTAAFSQEDVSTLRAQMDEILGDENPNKDLIDEIASLFALDDTSFRIIAPAVLSKLQQQLNDPNEKLNLVHALNAAGAKAEDLLSQFVPILDGINELPLSRVKKDFFAQVFGTLTNAINETEGIAKRIVPVPIEMCAEAAKMPTYSNINDAGADVYAIEDMTIKPGETKLVPTGLKIAPPPGYAILIHPRSGLSARTKMRIANSIGLCDASYRDEYKILIENTEPTIKDISYSFNDDGTIKITSILHGGDIHISKGQRIAQLRLVEVPKMAFYQVDNILEANEDNRGGGIGHSGDF